MNRRNVIPMESVVSRTYSEQILSSFGESLIAYWPLSELTGSTILDESGNEMTGVHTNTTLANALAPNGKQSPLFNGTSAYANVYSPGLAGSFNNQEGSLAVWVKATEQSNWTDAAVRTIAVFQFDANNQIALLKVAANSLRMRYTAGGTISGTQLMLIAPSGWVHLAITWSKSTNSVKLYYNGILQASFSNVGIWGGNIASAGARFGASAIPSTFWAGWISDGILLNRAMSYAEVSLLAFTAPNQLMPKIAYLGDSITSDSNDSWVDHVQNNYLNGSSAKINHAVGGHNIITYMDGQVTASANDDADIIIMALGTNDDDAGDMTVLQSKVEENIVRLKSYNPRSTIYYLNVLPKWTNSTGSVVVDRSHIRTAISDACSAQNVVCWDTFTEPWITASQTTDGTHLTSAGHLAVSAQVLSRL